MEVISFEMVSALWAKVNALEKIIRSANPEVGEQYQIYLDEENSYHLQRMNEEALRARRSFSDNEE